MTKERPKLDQRFQHKNRVYRVSAIAKTMVVGTLISVTRIPTDHTQVKVVTWDQFFKGVLYEDS